MGQYIRDHPEIAAYCKPFQKKILETKSAIKTLEGESNALARLLSEKKRLLKALTAEKEECKSQFVLYGNRTSKGKKRKYPTDEVDEREFQVLKRI